MSPGVFVAVDSGGTLTNVDIAVAYQNGDTRSACYEVGSSLSGALAPSLMPKVVGKILAPLLSELDDLGVADLPLYIWLSAAGYSQGTRDDFTSAIQNIDRHVAGGLVHSIGAANDAVSLLLAVFTKVEDRNGLPVITEVASGSACKRSELLTEILRPAMILFYYKG